MSIVCMTCCQPASSRPNKPSSAVCEFCTQAHVSQSTAHPSANMSLRCRRYSRAGFVIWHRQNQWPLKYVQCSSVAHAKLRQLLASHTALTAPADPPTAKADSDGDGSMSPSQPIQEEQDLIACRQDIVSLIPAIFSRFEGKDLASFDTPGFGTFGDIALAFGLPHIYVGFLKKKLKVNSLCCCPACCHFQTSKALLFLPLPL